MNNPIINKLTKDKIINFPSSLFTLLIHLYLLKNEMNEIMVYKIPEYRNIPSTNALFLGHHEIQKYPSYQEKPCILHK